jgi:hypothetical protein
MIFNNDFIKKIFNFNDEDLEKYREYEKNNAYICCFTDSPLNKLMWSHYSENHKGFCIEYDKSTIISGIPSLVNTEILPVEYVPNVQEITKSYTAFLGEFQKLSLKELIENYKLYLKKYYYKDNIWEYENEWRLAFLNENNEDRFTVSGRITAVYLGLNISIENNKLLVNLINTINKRDQSNPNYKKIKVFQIIRNSDPSIYQLDTELL